MGIRAETQIEWKGFLLDYALNLQTIFDAFLMFAGYVKFLIFA